MTLFNGDTPLAQALTNAQGRAEFVLYSLPVGQRNMRAVFHGFGFSPSTPSGFIYDPQEHLHSVSEPLSVTVSDQEPVSLAIQSSLNPSPPNTPITLTATIQELASESPTGTITFLDGTTTLATVPVDNNQATFTTSTLSIGAHNVTASYSGDANFAATQSAVLIQQVNPVTITLTPPTLAAGKVGTAFSQSITASGGTAPYTYTLTAGALPPGVTLNPSSGELTGTPSAGGRFAFTLTATDSTSQSAEQAYTLAIDAAEITITPTTLPAATRGFAIDTTFAAAGGVAPYNFSLAPGSTLPAGVTLSSTGMLSGVPTQIGSFNFTVQATDSATGSGPYTGTREMTLTVNAATIAVTPTTISNATVAQAYSQAFEASGGVGDIAFSLASGTLPAGLSLAADGTLAGTPTAGGNFAIEVLVTDAFGNTGSRSYTLTVQAPAITITPTTLPAATRGFAVNTTFVASGGTAPYSFALAPGSRLPAGVTLSSAGVVRGVPTEAGTFNFTVQATDSATGTGPYTGTRAFTWTVNGATIAISPVLLPPVLEGRNYGQALAANGGVAPYSFALTAGTLPQGLTLSSAGIISGTPQVAGPVSITVTATDAFGNTGVATISFNVIARPNPALSADIRTTLASEQGLSQRFAWTQLGNFQSRFDTLRSGGSGGGGGGPRGGLRLGSRVADSDVRAVNGSGLLAGGNLFGSAFDGGMGAGGRQDGMVDRFASDYGWNFAPGEREGDMQSGRQQETFSPFGPRDVGTWEFWTGGTLGIGRRDSVNGAARLDFQSEGISAGLDHKLSDRLSLGVGGGLGREHIDIGTDGSTSKGRNGVATVYGTFMPADDLFLDAVVGGGVLDFDVKRYDSNAAVFAEGAREGSMRFASLSFGINRTSDRLAWQAFGRIEHFGAALDAYTETGAGIWNLSYLERSVSSTASALGASAALNGLKIGSALFSPRLRVEWRHAFEDPGTQGIRYADWVDSPVYTVTESDLARDQLAIGLGAGLRLDNDWAVAADISGRFDRDTEAGSMRLEVSKRF